MNIFTNYLEKFGNNFLVAAMIPSLGWVIICIVVFDPILHVIESLLIENSIYSLIGISLVVGVPTIILGFTLTSLNTLILKIYEGYVLLHKLPLLRASQINKAKKLFDKKEKLKNDIDELKKIKNKTNIENLELDALKIEYYTIVADYDRQYPPTSAGIMATQFGNILKASESYSGTRYGIDGVYFWPRLWHVIPDDYKQVINEARNELSFLVNMSLLSFVFYILCFIAMLTSAQFLPNWDLFFINSVRYIIAGVIGLLLNRFFNSAALFSVGDFGNMIRSSYDLFRLDLLEKFRIKHPKTSVEEFNTWKNLGELIILGQESLDFKPLKYEVKKQKK